MTTNKTHTLLTLTSSLHKETANNPADDSFIKQIEISLGEEFDFLDESSNVTPDLIYVRTGGTEGLFKARFGNSLPANTRLLTSGKSNSLAASMEILSFLRQNGCQGEILHGTPESIAEKINSRQSDVISSETTFIHPLTGIDLGGIRLGVIGKPSDWLIASNVDYAKAKAKLNTELIDIPMSELLSRLPSEGLDMRSFEGSEAICEALRSIVFDYHLGGLTLRCFDLLDSVHNTGCLALARLNASGIPASCEGDIPALLSMAILQKETGCPGFQCNLSRIEGDDLLFAHCTVPLTMVSSYRYATHFESGIGTAIKGELKEGDVDIFKVSPDLETFVRIPGRLVRNTSEPSLCRTQVIVRSPLASTYLLHTPLANHHILTYR